MSDAMMPEDMTHDELAGYASRDPRPEIREIASDLRDAVDAEADSDEIAGRLIAAMDASDTDEARAGAKSEIEFRAGQVAGATHIVDDGGCLYGATTTASCDEVAAAFRGGYDGRLGRYDVTDVRTGEVSAYED